MKIRILDDEQIQRTKFLKDLRGVGLTNEHDLGLIDPDLVKDAFSIMTIRQTQFRKEGYWDNDSKSVLDDVDILVVDNELREFFGENRIFTSADEVAYMARCFSTCKVIVVMNRLAYNPFDLTLTLSYQRQFEAFSDLEIGEQQLSSKALWGIGDEDFHPWYWPILPKLLEDFEARLDDVKVALRSNPSILDFFGLSEFRDWLPRNMLQWLGSGKDYSFLEFLRTSPFAFVPKDRAALAKEPLDERAIESLGRVTVVRLSKWLEWKVLPELDVLVDAPHLVSRFPSLLDGDHGNLEVWNALATRHTETVPNLKMGLLQEWRFPKAHWLSRPAWYWRKVMNDDGIPDVREPWNIEYVPFVFCEDTSSFVPEEQAKPFRAEVESPFANRYIEQLDGVNYLPPQRLAL